MQYTADANYRDGRKRNYALQYISIIEKRRSNLICKVYLTQMQSWLVMWLSGNGNNKVTLRRGGFKPATQANSASPSLRGQGQWVLAMVLVTAKEETAGSA